MNDKISSLIYSAPTINPKSSTQYRLEVNAVETLLFR